MKPWMSDIEIDLVMKYLSSEKTMLEWGSGGSTNTFSKYVKKYYSIEHDNSWAKKIQNTLNDNVTFFHIPQSSGYSSNIPLRNIHSNLVTSYLNYIKQIHNIGEKYFDIILIDGRCRKWCAIEALKYIDKNSIVFIHDFYTPGREYYQDVFEYYDVVESIKSGQSMVALKPKENMVNIFYRLSDGGNPKEKPSYIRKEYCLSNFVFNFRDDNITVIADNVSESTRKMIQQHEVNIEHTDYKSGGKAFIHALEMACKLEDEKIVYFVEDDFLHKPDSRKIILEGLRLGADYISLYDHPDKYLDPSKGGNPQVEYGGEVTRLMLSESCHWKLSNSTVLTFATKAKTIKRDFQVWKKAVLDSPHLGSYFAFTELRNQGRSLITSVPGYSTHGETKWLTPLTDWSKV